MTVKSLGELVQGGCINIYCGSNISLHLVSGEAISFLNGSTALDNKKNESLVQLGLSLSSFSKMPNTYKFLSKMPNTYKFLSKI
jgi:hypothetical protein